jgi:hypothetical protein
MINSRKVLRNSDGELSDEELADMRVMLAGRGVPVENVDDDGLRAMVKMMGEGFRDNAPTTAAQAATIILDAVKVGTWRILVGDDAVALDESVRSDPIAAYEGLTLGTITSVMDGSSQ